MVSGCDRGSPPRLGVRCDLRASGMPMVAAALLHGLRTPISQQAPQCQDGLQCAGQSPECNSQVRSIGGRGIDPRLMPVQRCVALPGASPVASAHRAIVGVEKACQLPKWSSRLSRAPMVLER